MRARSTGAAVRSARGASGAARGTSDPIRSPRGAGSTDRSAAATDPFALLGAVLDLLAQLPADPPQTLPRFAASRCGGDPHALDRGRPLDALVLRALAHLDGDLEPASGAEARRERYDRWGLGCDALSSTVLVLGLRPDGDGPLAPALRAAADGGQPRVLTLRELCDVEVLRAGADAFCCENPDVVAAAADELGAACPPLMCTAGWPSTACLRLLRALTAGGATVHHHGDMDPEGLRILDRALGVTGGRLWRMSAADHAAAAPRGAALRAADVTGDLNEELQPLAASLRSHRRAVREEQVLAALLIDLRAAS
ncbi:MAG: TIGR02679 family protein [Solirubrobacteraceae bacterium MAG38_C4-C5]|nr:TIGR02679 family protein [Candidatus Siliceabacter maunaloa]